MTTFDEREQAAEGKFMHEEEMVFRAHARRNRQLGLWAAQLIGKAPEAASAYGEELVAMEVSKGNEAGIVARILQDLAAVGILKSGVEVRAKMDQLLGEAVAFLKAPG